MALSRHVPIFHEPRLWYGNEWYEPFHRDYHHHSGAMAHRDAFRDGALAHRDAFRDVARDVYRPLTPPPAVTGPISRSFFNPERQLATMDNEMHRMASEMRRVFSDMQHLVPVDSNPESWRIKENFHLDNPYQDHGSGRKMFRLQFDVRQFKPDEIYVKTIGNNLEVHAKHDEKSEGKSLHREYHRQYTLPKELNPENLVSKLTRDGVLSIEAPLPIDSHRDKLIPIDIK